MELFHIHFQFFFKFTLPNVEILKQRLQIHVSIIFVAFLKQNKSQFKKLFNIFYFYFYYFENNL